MYAAQNESSISAVINGLKPERVQDNLVDLDLDLGWSAVAPVQGIEKITTHATFAEAMDAADIARQQAQRMDHTVDIEVRRTLHDDYTLRLYIGRPIRVGAAQIDFDLAAAIDHQE